MLRPISAKRILLVRDSAASNKLSVVFGSPLCLRSLVGTGGA
jgi:hypothetical protein